MLLAAERGRPGGVYFLTDGPPRTLREVATALVRSQGLELPASAGSVPAWLVWAVATVDAWVAAACRRQPLISWQALALVIVDVTVSDARARRELGYVGRVTVAEGLERMRLAAQAQRRRGAAGGAPKDG
jgi:nucleoside-diphosphate-sugar epimerase